MKKFTIRGVLDGFRSTVSSGSSSSSTPKAETAGIEETIWSEHFQVAKTVRHGFPYQPTALAYDPVQNLVAIGTKNGSVRIFGRPGVDVHVKHDAEFAVVQLLFLVNEGAMVSVCADDQMHLWTLRQKKPEVVHSLKFQRERITFCHLPFQSKWMYVGSERGNVHIINLESFTLSGYVIMWNKAIELLRKTHPGPVVHLSDNQNEPNKLLIGYESGLVVLWDLKEKTPEFRYNYSEGVSLKSISWHHEGKQFVCSYSDGSLSYWNVRAPQKPASTIMPHSKMSRDGKPEACRPILKVDLRTVRTGEPYLIFSGGMPYEKSGHTPTMTIMRGTSTTVLEMDHPVIDFVSVCSTPWNNDFQDPVAIVVLLVNDFVVIDLTSPGFPCFENPYQMDLHESPVTSCLYFADCPHDLIPAFYSVGCRQKKSGYSEKEWPIKGGEWGTATCSYPEIILTGHADGSLKFWDASAVTLQILYKLKTAKVFDAGRSNCPESDYPFAINMMYLCLESRLLCVAGSTHVVLFHFTRQETVVECMTLEISIMYDICDGPDSPESDMAAMRSRGNASQGAAPPSSGSVGSYSSSASNEKDLQTSLKTKQGPRKWPAGYQPDVCCLLTLIDGEPAPPVTSLVVNSRLGLLAFGNECGLAVIDIVQKTCLLNLGTPDIYGSMDPHSRAPRLRSVPDGILPLVTPEDIKSPITDQCDGEHTADSRSPVTTPSGIALPNACVRRVGRTELTAIAEYKPEVAVDATTVDLDSCQAVQEEKSPSICSLVTEESESMEGSDVTFGLMNDDDPKVCVRDRVDQLPSPTERIKRKSVTLPIIITEDNNNTSETLSDNPKRREPKRRASTPHGPAPPLLKLNLVQSRSSGELVGEAQLPVTAGASSEVKPKTLLHATRSDTCGIASRDLTEDRLNLSCGSLLQTQNSTLTTGVAHDEAYENLRAAPMTAPVLMHKSDHTRLLGKMNRKIRSCLRFKPPAFGGGRTGDDEGRSSERQKLREITVIDVSSDDLLTTAAVRRMNYTELFQLDKTDSSFCRSQSSSISSLENVSKEAIQCIAFADTYARKTDACTCPCLWIGTSLGSILVLQLGLPSDEVRNTEPVAISPSGTIFRLKGAVLSISFLDCNGILIPSTADPWKDPNVAEDSPSGKEKKSCSRQHSSSNMKVHVSPTPSSGELITDRQFAVVCSEKQARVLSLPSQTCTYKVKVTETSMVAKADVIPMKESVCLVCYLLNGHIMTFSLPSLKPLLDVDYIPLPDIRVARTICFSSNCHVLYFCSPSELQKLTLSAEVCDTLNEMWGELFLPCDMPEAPKQGFFKNLFNIGSNTLDREELFGEASSGKAAKGVVKYTSGIGQVQESAVSACSEIGRAKQAALERGEKLGELEEKTERMRMEAEEYSKLAHQLKLKYRDKKWYQF